MDINIVDQTSTEMRFELKDATVSFANMLRRAMMNSVPIYAIDSIVIYENFTELLDEYIAHRLGLIPLRTPDNTSLDDREVIFSLDVSGPAKVYSKDLVSSDAVVKVAVEEIPLFVIGEGKALRIEAKARPGLGNQHAKFQACLASYEEKAEGNYEFYVESFYQKKPIQIFKEALDMIKKKSDNYIGIIAQKQ